MALSSDTWITNAGQGFFISGPYVNWGTLVMPMAHLLTNLQRNDYEIGKLAVDCFRLELKCLEFQGLCNK